MYDVIAEMLKEFSAATGGYAHLSEDEWIELRISLLEEEVKEWVRALRNRDWLNFSKESADVVYIVWGSAMRPGLDMLVATAEVHASNMSKIGPDGKFRERADGKILKGPNYFEPDMRVAFSHGVPS